MLKDLYQYLIIKSSGLFDINYYLKSNPDVRLMDMDPILHYIKFGWKEERNPSRYFKTKSYLKLNPDVKKEGINPLVHYQRHGKKEGRLINYYKIEKNAFSYIDLSSKDARQQAIIHNSNFPPTQPDIIIFPIIDWEFRFQRPQQLACQLANSGHRVFYFMTDFRKKNGPLVKAIKKNIYSVQLSSNDKPLKINTTLSETNLTSLTQSIRILKDHFLINSAIMMVDLPYWGKLAARLRAIYGWKLFYDCMDLHKGFSNSSASTHQDEQFLLQQSDCVFASSNILYQHALKENDKCVLIPNGTDYQFFHQASNPIKVNDIKNTPSPIIGYYGAIADWFDTKLIGELATDNPEWSFLLIGSTELANLNPLNGLENVHLLGEKPYATIPGYLSNFDVCIIPFKRSPLTQATNPVKLFEYLSAGKPIVSTRLEEISRYENFVRLAETKEEWQTAIQDSLVENKTKELLNQRYEFAQANTWDKHAEKIEREMLSLFPKVSIIVISYNNLKYTKLCLESIINNTSYPKYEIIIVDNASDRETVAYLEQFQSNNNHISVIFNKENLGFSKANNQGFEKSSGEYIVFLNNDTIVTPGWVHRLLLHLKKNPSVGMVGPVTNAIGNEAKIDVPYHELEKINQFAAKRSMQYSGKSFAINVLALFCCMISKDLLIQVDGLDERYEVGMFEDDDLAKKVHSKGKYLRCAQDVFIHHFHGVSFKKMGDEQYQSIFSANKKRFEDKWQTQWQPHQYKNEL
jgi:GT2 family glycosyltransferase/glycosyltransferase involved in cell wall biosynthesis